MQEKQAQGRLGWWVLLVVLTLLIIDQAIKIWVKTTMVETQAHEITSWFYIYFIENEGMAYGITLGSKLFLTLFRVIAMGLSAYYLSRLIKQGTYAVGFIMCLALIVAGGVGNIIDSLFYGEIFTSSVGQVSQLVPWGEGYGGFLHGKVVDMFYFPLIKTTYPEWFPFYGGEPFIFFAPVFNFADACISVGVAALLLFYPRTFAHMLDAIGKKKGNEPQAN